MNDTTQPEQLTLISAPDVPVRFRLDSDTRRRGIAHVAEIRQVLAERRAAKAGTSDVAQRHPIRPTAA